MWPKAQGQRTAEVEGVRIILRIPNEKVFRKMSLYVESTTVGSGDSTGLDQWFDLI